jgi:hypothetical protein
LIDRISGERSGAHHEQHQREQRPRRRGLVHRSLAAENALHAIEE